MADQLYLSLWFPNFRVAGLAPALVSVIRQFGRVGGSSRVAAATVYPISRTEAPTYQRIYSENEMEEAIPELAVAAATESLHDDFAYEFDLIWDLWTPEVGGGLDPIWRKEPSRVSVIGFGPEFDDGAYEQNGHIRVDFGIDTPFLHEDVDLDLPAVSRVKENVQLLVDFTNAVQEHCGISSRLLWSESGESLAQKLVERLQRVN
ncbi:hypothetical protein ACPOL_2446 [Acidisarcina polymorpha]|uniref:Uncharacterized protein n=1 Tax=Acidisarcina polymorpha TaxID=2211140 RepID=A0A2Z5FY18_9BACT|nr:hypothetical protein [Acidisarcina polymorpha]AXC11768.1 hypothetical protein ACPOL_2446 [Acidisarcina polymorpha]